MSRFQIVSTAVLVAALGLGSGLLFRAGHHAVPARPLAPVRLEAAALREDVRFLRRALQAAHPGLYWYTPKPALDSVFTRVERGLTEPLSERAFFVRLLPVVAAVRCSHTSLAPSTDPAGFGAARHRYLPLALAVLDGRVYIRACYAPHPAGVVGAELTRLNHQPTAQVLARLLPLIPADGFNTTAKYEALSRGAFVEGYTLLNPLADSVALRVQPPAGPPLHLKLPTLGLPALETHRAAARREKEDFSLAFEDHGRVALLRIPTFAPLAGAMAFRDFLRRSFQQMKQRGASVLILDVRGNPGGDNSLVTDLFAYVAARPFLHIRRAELKATALPYLSPPRQLAGLDTVRTPADAAGYYDVRFRYPGAVLRAPVGGLRFRGRVLVLMDGGTASAASELAALARAQGRATLLGEEAGGGYAGATGGHYLNLALPASRLRVRIPTVRIWLAVEAAPAGHGALPDVKAVPTPAEIVSGRDGLLARALALAHTAGPASAR